MFENDQENLIKDLQILLTIIISVLSVILIIVIINGNLKKSANITELTDMIAEALATDGHLGLHNTVVEGYVDDENLRRNEAWLIVNQDELPKAEVSKGLFILEQLKLLSVKKRTEVVNNALQIYREDLS